MAAGVRPKKIGKVNLFKIDWTGKERKKHHQYIISQVKLMV